MDDLYRIKLYERINYLAHILNTEKYKGNGFTFTTPLLLKATCCGDVKAIKAYASIYGVFIFAKTSDGRDVTLICDNLPLSDLVEIANKIV